MWYHSSAVLVLIDGLYKYPSIIMLDGHSYPSWCIDNDYLYMELWPLFSCMDLVHWCLINVLPYSMSPCLHDSMNECIQALVGHRDHGLTLRREQLWRTRRGRASTPSEWTRGCQKYSSTSPSRACRLVGSRWCCSQILRRWRQRTSGSSAPVSVLDGWIELRLTSTYQLSFPNTSPAECLWLMRLYI